MSNFKLQLFRNSIIYATKDAALAALNTVSKFDDRNDGEPIICRYYDGDEVKTIFGILSKTGEGANVKTHVTIYSNTADTVGAITSLTVVDNAIEGEYVTAVSQTDGKIKVSRSPIAIAADKITATAITGSTDKVNVDGTNVQAQIESLAKSIKSVSDNASKYTIRKVTTGLEANVKESYELVAYTGELNDTTNRGTVVGEPIKVYKDGSLKSVELGTDAKAQTIIFTYDVEGTDKTIELDLAQAIFEADFGNGLEVNASGKVSVKRDATSEGFLTVGTGGVKLSGVQDAIDAAVEAEKTRAEAAEQANATAIDTAIKGLDFPDDAVDGQYVSSVSQTDGVIKVAHADVSKAILNGYVKGTDYTDISAIDTIATAFGKLENKIANETSNRNSDISGLKEKVIGEEKLPTGKTVMDVIEDNELVTATAFNKFKTVLGIDGDEVVYEPSTNDVIKTASSYKSADELLAAAITVLQTQMDSMDVIDCGTY